MIVARIIPCLDVDGGRVVKGTRFVELRDAGDPVELAARYDTEGADELVLLEGYKVSSTRENTMLNMVASFITTFAITRWITHTIRAKGRLGPIRNLAAGGRHIHHLVPGTVLSLVSGAAAISLSREPRNRWLAIPFGIGGALVLDEAALLLELDDVYWSDEGKLSVQIAFATMGLLGAIGYAVQVNRRGEPGSEHDWRAAAKAWEDLQLTPGSTVRSIAGGTP